MVVPCVSVEIQLQIETQVYCEIRCGFEYSHKQTIIVPFSVRLRWTEIFRLFAILAYFWYYS